MEGRKRTVQVKFYVTEEERRLIREKMKLIPTRNMAAYLRKMVMLSTSTPPTSGRRPPNCKRLVSILTRSRGG